EWRSKLQTGVKPV
ncbi:radical SAM superfamily protein, partial [Vibrio parahaemolyticus V-223/04]